MAIEPIKGFYVHDEETNTDGVAKVSIEAVQEFEDDIRDETSNWLDEHPEATTTVQDGAITKAKINTEFLPEIENAYVTPEMFGAKGDGVTDDGAAFLQALNSGAQVYLANSYYIANPINNPAMFVLIGDKKNSKIIAPNGLFNANINGAIIDQVNVEAKQTGEQTATAFNGTCTGLRLTRSWFRYFNVIFGTVNGVSYIAYNSFTFIKDKFVTTLVDSFIVNNYINSPMYTNPRSVLCDGTISHSSFVGNFVDYFYKVFAAQSMYSFVVTGNVFDVNYCVFYNQVSGVTCTGNTFSNVKKRTDWDVSGNEDMDTKPWCVIRRDARGDMSQSVFSGNSFTSLNVSSASPVMDMYLVTVGNPYPTRHFLIDEALPPEFFNYAAYKSGNANDMEDVMIRPMLYRTVSSLPSPSLTGSVVSFNHDIVTYNNNLYINVDGTWKQMTA